ncbi:MAG: DNA adenine methylase [Armatimonadetes bacterium]|nr:DNA adenine methylase [Armatimonadota bacterium]
MTATNHSYLTDQLIPYIGNKRNLLPLIKQAIERSGVEDGVFFDAFAGSGVVSRLAKMMGLKVIANDWEPYAETINTAYISVNREPAFGGFGGLDRAISELNALNGVRGYIASHYCPCDDENYDTDTERMFYTQHNGRKIDAVREQIARWRDSGRLSRQEEALLLAPLIYQASYCSNTSGVFKGFHNGWGGATKTAWYRIRSRLSLQAPELYDNGEENIVCREAAATLARKIECDIAYLDPPYNQHQYGANYHLLNTVALWDKPEISRRISSNGERDKAAIRKDWRELRRSDYCYKSTALDAFCELIGSLQAKWILVSYSTDGIIKLADLLGALANRGELSVVCRPYKRYRVSSQRPSPRPHTVEFVAIVDTSKAPGRDDLELAADKIMRARETNNGG